MVAERSLTSEEKDEIREAIAAIDIEDLDVLDELVESVRSGEAQADDELLFHLGAWFGDQVRRLASWKWVHLTFGEGLEAPALVSQDRGVALLPLQLVADVLEGRSDNVLRVILERLEEGQRPKGEPGSYAIVG